MTLTEKMTKLLEIIRDQDREFRKNNSAYKAYFSPNIPEKVIKKLTKYYDNHLAINTIIAFYDDSLLSNCKSGIIFATDGFYYKFMSKPLFIRYYAIKNMYVDNKNYLHITVPEAALHDETIICAFDGHIFKNILDEIIKVDIEYGQHSVQRSGVVRKLDIPKDMMEKCRGYIHGASAACGGVGTGLAQIPASDNAVIVPIQIGMIIALGSVFDLNITESGAKSLIASASASIVGRTISQFLVGWIPVVGNVVNTATAAGVTEAIGWIAVENFYKRWLEDKNKGRIDGMKDGYNAASVEYENKLRKQAEMFINKIEDFSLARDKYENLLTEYEAYIQELEEKCASIELI